MASLFALLVPLSLLAYALLGGVFLAFSDFLMRALAHTSGIGGAEAMQVINREVFRWVFMALFLGMAPVSLALTGYGVAQFSAPMGPFLALAGLCYLIGCFGVTVVFNVPMNQHLDGLELTSDTLLEYWKTTYLPRWTFWNSVRTLACVVSSAILLAGLVRSASVPVV